MSDLVKRLRIKAGMIEMGEMIAWGSDSALMREAANALEMAAPAVHGEPLRYTNDGALDECPCCGSLDVGGAHDTVHCYSCDLTVTKPRPLQNAIDAWNTRTGGDVEPKELGGLILPAVDGGEYPDCDIEWDSGVAERLQEQLACHEDVNLPIYVGGAPPQTAKVPEGLINSLSVIEKYIRDEADFNRSWTDGRRGGEPDSHPAGYNERRLQVAAERDEWADGLAKAIAMLTAAHRKQPEGEA